MSNWTTPKEFYDAVLTNKKSDSKVPSYKDKDTKKWTTWFEKLMLKVAEGMGYHCQNRSTPDDHTEWMNIDHVFVEKSHEYDQFPIITVEHENGGLGGDGKKLPSPEKKYAPMEWAFWKCLSMKCQLSVLVAYPERNEEDAIKEFDMMLKGWCTTYKGQHPNVLVMFGDNGDASFTYKGWEYSSALEKLVSL